MQGKLILPYLVAEHKEAYGNLTSEEREEIVRLYEESKATLATGKRISLTSRVNDISSTLALIENKVTISLFFLLHVIYF